MANDRIVLAHGGGGSLSRELVEDVIAPALGTLPRDMPDAAWAPGAPDFALAADAFVVKPLFFPGGDIGRLSVHGSLNDLAVAGAEPLAIAISLVIEEGLAIETLERVLRSAGRAAAECGTPIIAGDTKVVARGEADELFVSATALGRKRIEARPGLIRPGDQILLSGCLADHGVAVLSARQGMEFETPIESDSACLWPLVAALIEAGVDVHAMRDPTRGGLAACCAELADTASVSMELEEAAIPVRAGTAAACGMLGLDPLTVANEGKLVAFVGADSAQRALAILREQPLGRQAAIVGQVQERQRPAVAMRTRLGGRRVVRMPYGEDLPRIC
ncbi:MAG: Hydrogenase expression/formation protein HypE [candidate division BRC1 bacterium ADurb.BinA364]|nr:MAG: Hydrogenase expression/formation protein HypE [candidate division BRC1 bacterium ADurb.BinA364]